MTSPKTYSKEAMSAAIADVKNNNLSIRKSSKKYGVPKSTLSDHVKGKIQEGSTWGSKPVFNTEDEKEMINLAIKRSEMGVGFSKPNFLRFVGAMAEVRGNQFKMGKPSDMWWRRFKSRHKDFSLRSPEPTGTMRHDAMSRQRIATYFEELGKIVLSPGFKDEPSRIWNMDETGVNLSHKPNKVLAKRGARSVHGKTSTSRELITVIACGNADGRYLPPHFVIPGKTQKKLDGYDLESVVQEGSVIKGANFSVSDSGWTKDGIARLWFTETFLKNIGPARPQLLICDGHGSHNNVEFVDLAKQNDIIIVELPSHTSNWTQPFDRSVFKSLKSHWNTTLDDFIKKTGVAVGHKQFLRLFNIAWQAALTPSTIRNGFAATGIYPFNPHSIPDEAFAPNEGCVSEIIAEPAALSGTEKELTISSSSNNIESCSLSSSYEETEGVFNKSSDTVISTELDNVSSITLSVPLNLDGELTLPVVFDPLDGLVLDSSNTSNYGSGEHSVEICSSKCSPQEALDVIESALTSEQKLRFQAAFLSGSNNTKLNNDPLFKSWSYYTEKNNEMLCDSKTMSSLDGSVSVASAVQPIVKSGTVPTVTSSCSASATASVSSVADQLFPIPYPVPKRNRKRGTEYFVITADEVFSQKKKALELKRKQEEIKEQKRVERERKRAEKVISLTMKKSKVKKTQGQNSFKDIKDML